jgi:hypothetical protein
VVHDDGSLDDQDERTLRQHITGIKYISRAQSDRELQALLPGPVFAARQANVFMLKLFDYNHFNAGEKTIALDSDLVFTGPPGEILEWMRQQGDTSFYNADLKRDTIRSAHDPRISERVPYFNAGFMGYSGRFTLEELTGICRRLDYFREDQTIYAHLLADKNPSKLPRERYFVYDGVKIPASACMVHFVSDNRFKKSAYIDLARATIGLLGKSAG